MIILITLINIVPTDGVSVKSNIHNISERYVQWTSYTFPGFYYNIDKDFGTESLYFNLSYVDDNMSTAILSDHEESDGNRGATYITKAWPNYFDFALWGQYEEMGFLGKNYFAGYYDMIPQGQPVSLLYDKSENKNLMRYGQLSEILTDDSTERVVNSSTPLDLYEGYQLAIKAMDPDGNKIHLELTKDNQVVDSKIISPSVINARMEDKTYYYKRDLGETKGIVILAVHFKDTFKSNENYVAIIDGVFQISDMPISITSGQQYGEMSIKSIDPVTETLILDNKDHPITLSKNRDIALMGNIHIITANQDTSTEYPLRYYLYYNDSVDYANHDQPGSSVSGLIVPSKMNATEVLDRLQGGQVNFDNKIIEGKLDLSNWENINDVHFNNTLFQGGVDFYSTKFNGITYFVGTKFNGDADFRSCSFMGYADFEGSKFNGDAYFGDSKFGDDATFWSSKFNGYTDFANSSFRRYAFLGDCSFNSTVNFTKSRFNSYAAFNWSIFQKDISFVDSTFNQSTSFKFTRFKDDVLFDRVKFNNSSNVDLSGTKYDRLFIRWSDIKEHLTYDDGAYLLLIKNFRNLGLLEDADDCYYQYRKVHLSYVWVFYKPFDAAAQVLYGYGVQPLYPIIWAICSTLGFGLFFWQVGRCKIKFNGDNTDKTEFEAFTLLEAIKFSLMVLLSGAGPFLSISSDLSRAGKYKNLALVEKLWGSLLFGLFLIALGKTIIREVI
jgi:S-layer protein (TIGR01567 family)